MRPFLALFFLLPALGSAAQQMLSGVLLDSASGQPIPYASVYVLDARRSGTLTNAEGQFRLSYRAASDTIVISHLGYRGLRQPIHALDGDTLRLPEKALNLATVQIYGGTGASLFRSVLAALDRNHAVEPVIYHVFFRWLQYESDRSALHTITEYSMEAFHAPGHSTELNIIQARKKGFSAAGKSWAENIYLAHTAEVFFHSLHKSALKWRESTLKHYEIEIAGSTENEGRSLIRLELTPRKPGKDPAFTLYVDEATYAVARLVRYLEPDRRNYQEIAFREQEGKWYLSHVITRASGSSFFQRYQPGSISDSESVYIYNLLPDAKRTEAFKGMVSYASTPKEEYLGRWEDRYWDTYRDIPLPAWIQKIVEADER
jgi:hypothetical protein